MNNLIDKILKEAYFNESNNTVQEKIIYHTTTPEIAEDIMKNGFKNLPVIDYKYYSTLGKDGVYFYDNKRLVQQYAGFLNMKLKREGEKVAIIKCSAPKNIIKNGNDNDYFVSMKNISKIKILGIELKKYGEIY